MGFIWELILACEMHGLYHVVEIMRCMGVTVLFTFDCLLQGLYRVVDIV